MVIEWVGVVLAALLSSAGLYLAALRAKTRAQLTLDADPAVNDGLRRRVIGALAVWGVAIAVCVALLPGSEPGWGVSGGLAVLACTWPAAVAVARPARAWLGGLPLVIVAAALALGWLDPMWRVSFLSIASFLPLVFVLVSVVSPATAGRTPGVGGNLTEPKR